MGQNFNRSVLVDTYKEVLCWGSESTVYHGLCGENTTLSAGSGDVLPENSLHSEIVLAYM